MSGCWHCGEPLPADPPQVRVGGVAHPVCCHGCRAVAEWIAELGLADYYRLRSACAAPAPDLAAAQKDAEHFLRPELARHVVRSVAGGRSETVVLIEGLRCAACAWLVERTLYRLAGIAEVGVNAAAQRARVVYDSEKVSIAQIVQALARVGYRALPLDRAAIDDTRQREARAALKRLAVAAFGAMQAMMYATALWFGAFDDAEAATRDAFRWLTLLAATPVVFYSAAPFFAGARRLVAARTLGMDVPVALAIALIYAGSVVAVITRGPEVYFESASMFVFFLCAGRYLEMRARHRTCDLSDALARASPAFADRLLPGGALQRVGALELAPGDRIVVADGARVPADGTLESGECRVDESMLSGESALLARRGGDTLLAGSLVAGAPAVMRVTRVGTDTVVGGIVALAARASTLRPRLARANERVAARFAAGVLLLAAITALAWAIADPARAFAATVAVLVVSCPCAFALAAPAAFTRTLAVLASRGVLVVRPDALEELAAATHAVFDKTGTLTEPSITREGISPAAGGDRDAALRLAAALAQGSSHPIARAFVAAGPDALPAVVARESSAGRGVGGTVGGQRYRLGRADYALARADAPRELADAVVLAGEHGVIASFEVGERLKPGARAAIEALTAGGLRIAIASGDANAKVEAIASSLGVTHFASRQSPADKLAGLASLRASGARVIAVGDGVNDAPVLAGADVGVAVGSAADAAQAASDVVLTARLGGLAQARALARAMLAILRQNRRWAIAYNVAVMPLAALGWVPPWLAAIGMSASSLAVVLNSLRIGRARDAKPEHATAPLVRRRAPA